MFAEPFALEPLEVLQNRIIRSGIDVYDPELNDDEVALLEAVDVYFKKWSIALGWCDQWEEGSKEETPWGMVGGAVPHTLTNRTFVNFATRR